MLNIHNLTNNNEITAYMNDKSLTCRTGRVSTVWKSNGSKQGSNETDERYSQ